ncbi:hypothetical protein EXE46_01960 [Halorubrum sp. GN11_10-6_MGM]|uniref:hypothetical protein n=1 Tax=Halorubrum sp. GN11_10-6_MGM TaxID=2518112 RepID=UPI0010F95D24|nr:hypothetical protein [Halorubrum sp. GN11_10-6_MGM]TKX75888.1 hypothetical protein EXE46_01960 [Halorubrum sp. GN11_10-6_MGM]
MTRESESHRESEPRRESRSRRGFLAGIAAAGAAATAGCSGVPFAGGEERREAPASLPSDAVGPVEWPASPFPVTVPESLASTHESRTRELLDAVPAEASIPNEAVAAAIGDDRERASRRANAEIPDGWPVDDLSAWRHRREDAAAVRGAHRAATGTDDGVDLAARRRAVRDDRGALASGLEYRAESPAAAVLAYEPVESLLAECARHVEPRVTYPDDPIAEPFRAGEVVGHVERARAAASDAEGLRDAYLDGRDGATSQWASLVAAAGQLRGSVSRTRAAVRRRTNDGTPSGDEDLSGTVAQELLAVSGRRAESAVTDAERAADAGEHATAVIEAGTGLADIEARRRAVAEIGDGRFREVPSESSVRSAAERAHTAVRDAVERGGPLARRLVRPGVETLAYVADRIEEGYASPRRTQAELAYVDLYAGAVPATTAFVRERLA